MSITKKRKVSIWAYVMIAILVVTVIVLAVLHITGLFDLSPVGDGVMGVAAWSAADIVNFGILCGGIFVSGIITWYAWTTYIVGIKIPMTTYNQSAYGGYNPQPTQPSQQQQEDETVIS